MQLRAAYAHLRRGSSVIFGPFGLTSDQYVLLWALARAGEATQQELVRRSCSDTATIGTMLTLLEKKGLVKRTRHPSDGRAWHVRLTRKGSSLVEEMTRSSAAFRANLVGLFSEGELRALGEFLERLAGAMRPPERTTAAARARRTPPRDKPRARTAK
jgi:DNA-binding MarR family transcriptional regulator